jgi:proteasome lid subunit RPN8/RPN11
MTIAIPDSIARRLVSQADSAMPLECCGLLSGERTGDRWVVRRFDPLVNELASPIAFRSESRSMFAAMRATDAAGETPIAVSHSHPASPPNPSVADREQHMVMEYASVILGRVDGAWRLAAWWPAGGWCPIMIEPPQEDS